jgi:hypothetical protein
MTEDEFKKQTELLGFSETLTHYTPKQVIEFAKAYHLHCLESVSDGDLVVMFREPRKQTNMTQIRAAQKLRDHLIQKAKTNQPI